MSTVGSEENSAPQSSNSLFATSTESEGAAEGLQPFLGTCETCMEATAAFFMPAWRHWGAAARRPPLRKPAGSALFARRPHLATGRAGRRSIQLQLVNP